jgi:CcmD family protein
MNFFRTFLVLFVLAPAAFDVTAYARSQPQQPPKQQDEFIPIDELPPQDQLPAAPLLIAAYSFVALALFAYVISVARRLGSVQRELERLESEVKQHNGRT